MYNAEERMTRDWLTVSEIATATKFHPSTVTRWILDGDLEGYRIGARSFRVPRRAWEEYLERQRAAPRPAEAGKS